MVSQQLAQPGSSFRGRFELKSILGVGAMAEVHLAFDSFSQREVAVKLTRLQLFEDPEIGQRNRHMWLNETRLAGRLRHPCIVEIYEAGLTDDFGYLVMEYVDGVTLRTHALPKSLLPIDAVIEIIYKVCNALEYAATMGLLHRDIKPANVMLKADGTVKVTDFGACYLANIDETQVFDVGTPAYMPPEQFTRQTPTVQSDIYAVGVMAFQLLTGALPFSTVSLTALIQDKLQGAFVPLEHRRPDIPAVLCRAIHRAISSNPEMRYHTWQAFAEDLALALPRLDQPRAEASESARFDVLRKLPLFLGFTDAQLWEVVRIARWRVEAPSTVIFDEGGVGAAVFVVVRGETVVIRGGAVLNTLGAGECFGEIAFFDEAWPVRSATVMAKTPLVLIEIDAQSLRQASDGLQIAFSRELTRTLISRLRHADQRLLEALSMGISFLMQKLDTDPQLKQ